MHSWAIGALGLGRVDTEAVRWLELVQQVPPALPLPGHTALVLCTIPAREAGGTESGGQWGDLQGGEGEQPLAELPERGGRRPGRLRRAWCK